MVKTCFPVTYSTLSPEGLMAQALPQYDLGTVRSCQFWCRGLSDVYLVEAKHQGVISRYVLRVTHAHWRSHPEVAFELDLLEFYRSQALPVAYALPTRSGEFLIPIQALEGVRYAALFVYAPGGVAVGDLSPVQSHILGETLARCHQAGQDFESKFERSPLSVDYLLAESLDAIAPFFHDRPADLKFLTEVVVELQTELRSLPQDWPYWTVCWGDPHSGNVHFVDRSPTLFDFDQCAYGWRAFDVAKFFQVGVRGGISLQLRQAFLNGYQSIAPLADWELENIRRFTQASHLWSWSIALINAQLHDYSRLDGHYFSQRLEQLKRLRSPDCQLY